jgi:hypothetical protein
MKPQAAFIERNEFGTWILTLEFPAHSKVAGKFQSEDQARAEALRLGVHPESIH